MGRREFDHGSEHHLRRLILCRTATLNSFVKSALAQDGVTGVVRIRWLKPAAHYGVEPDDREFKSVDFLPDNGGNCWLCYWPDTEPGAANRQRGMPSWDGVGRISYANANPEWLLVEAKAHEVEFTKSPGSGAGGTSKERIVRAFTRTAQAMGVASSDADRLALRWLAMGSYQVANRLAILHFLMREALPAQPARLLFIYFYGNAYRGDDCPPSPDRWKQLIQQKCGEMGVPADHGYASRVHYLFVNVQNDNCTQGVAAEDSSCRS
jgi:hypothetical protein